MNNAGSPKRTPFSFRCPLPLYHRMEKHATALHMDISEFIFAALQHSLGTPAELDKALSSLKLTHPPKSKD